MFLVLTFELLYNSVELLSLMVLSLGWGVLEEILSARVGLELWTLKSSLRVLHLNLQTIWLLDSCLPNYSGSWLTNSWLLESWLPDPRLSNSWLPKFWLSYSRLLDSGLPFPSFLLLLRWFALSTFSAFSNLYHLFENLASKPSGSPSPTFLLLLKWFNLSSLSSFSNLTIHMRI